VIRNIIKRDGLRQEFQAYKIEDAIIKAFRAVGKPYDSAIFATVIKKTKEYSILALEDIQDTIEKELFNADHFEAMKAFITYRFMRKMQREHSAGVEEDTTYIDCSQTIEEYINGTDWRISANSNTSYSNAGLVNNSAGKAIANYWLDKVYSRQEGYHHRNGDYHIHDLDCLTG
jgi:ribonucleoside-triphosphate reductase